MTWEFSVALSVAMICGTVISIFSKKTEPPVDLTPLKEELAKIRSEHEGVQKLAEETKKLLSQQNLAQGLRTR